MPHKMFGRSNAEVLRNQSRNLFRLDDHSTSLPHDFAPLRFRKSLAIQPNVIKWSRPPRRVQLGCLVKLKALELQCGFPKPQTHYVQKKIVVEQQMQRISPQHFYFHFYFLRSEYSPQWPTDTRSFSFVLARASPSLPRSVGSRRGQVQRSITRPYQH